MNINKLLINHNIMKLFLNIKETYEEVSKKKDKIENEIKKNIGGMKSTTFYYLIIFIIIIALLLPIGLLYIYSPETIENLF